MRTKLIVGNWKMNKTATEAATFAQDLGRRLTDRTACEIVLAPPFTALHALQAAVASLPSCSLGAQNMYWQERGAFTGEISGPMLKDLDCRYVILGHSERRQLFGEDDDLINKKVQAALRQQLRPILCVGESLAEREAGHTESVVTTQLMNGLAGLTPDQVQTITIAYEPVWAIGTGRAASADQAAEVHQALRRLLEKKWGVAAGEPVRILYGGSVTPNNAKSFLALPDIDGALVGGACLDPDSFATIIRAAQP